jgi:uncharacterized protein YjbI with pentapeptide repeats
MKSKLATRILKYLLIASVGIALFYTLIWIALKGYSVPWTGFGDFTKPDGEFVRGKTLWDWMQLFIIPIFLSLGVFLLNRSERDAEREIGADRQRETALQTYLDRMADLLLKEELRTAENEEVRNVARTRTLTVLRGLDSNRKGLVLRFLDEAGLINGEKIIVKLGGADLSRADLRYANLSGANLSGAQLLGNNLSGANLSSANLSDAKLLGRVLLLDADLTGAYLNRANLIDAILLNATLSRADLSNANLKGAILNGAILNGSPVDIIQLRVLLSPRTFEFVPIFIKDSSKATNDAMKGVMKDTREHILKNLKNSDLQAAKEQLATVKSLKGATMPDGTKHD